MIMMRLNDEIIKNTVYDQLKKKIGVIQQNKKKKQF